MMKKILTLWIATVCLACYGCSSDSSSSPDPLQSFRSFGSNLWKMINDAGFQVLDEIPASTAPEYDDYITAYYFLSVEASGLSMAEDIAYDIRTFTSDRIENAVFTDTDNYATITIDSENNLYIYSITYRATISGNNDIGPGFTDTIKMTLTWSPDSDRWLLEGLREGAAGGDVTVPWLKVEGEVDGTDYYVAGVSYYEEDTTFSRAYICTMLGSYTGSDISVSMDMELADGCDALTCVAINSTDLYGNGVDSLADFSTYGMITPPADYSIQTP